MVWPLGAPLANQYGLDDESPVITTPMEQGPQRVTRISTQYTTTIEISINVTNAELQTYRTWYEGPEAMHGAGWFDMPIRTTLGTSTHLVRIIPNTWRSKFIRDDLWRLSMMIETEEHIA